MNFSYTAQEEAFRAELRDWLQRNVPTEPPPATLEAEAEYLTRWQRRVFDAGWAAVHWPRQYGGRGASLTEQAIFQEEMARARAPQMMNRVGINLVGPTLIAHGSEEQRRRYLREDPQLRGDLVSALLGAQRRIRPGVAAHPCGGATATRIASAARRCGPATRSSRRSASCWRAPIPTRRRTAASAT